MALLASVLPAPAAAQAPAAAAALTVEQQEAFLATARVVKRHSVSTGVTGTVRATLTDGTITHDASVQAIDERKAQYPTGRGVEFNFRDSWTYNVAAYRLARLLGIDTIPPSVKRAWEGSPASFTWWVDDVLMDGKQRVARNVQPPDPQRWNRQMYVVRVFDQLIANVDRNLGNFLITRDWTVWMIDHSRSFRLSDTLRDPQTLTRCDRQLLERLRGLDPDTVQRDLGDYLTRQEIDALFKRRDLIVSHFDALGPGVLFDLEKR
jgi:hypothetical protein